MSLVSGSHDGYADRRWVWRGICVGLVLSIPVIWSALFDDAYIHARIARNLIENGTFAYTSGDRFKASSSTGYVLILAILMKWLAAETAIRGMAAAAIVATSVGLSKLFHLLGRGCQASTLYAALLAPFALVSAYGGMETPIACALMVWSAIALRQGSEHVAIGLISVGVWFRFEMLALLFASIAVTAVRTRSIRFLSSTWPAFALILFELYSFGSIVPNAAVVKPLVYAVPIDISILVAITLGAGWLGLYAVGLIFISTVVSAAECVERKQWMDTEHPFLIMAIALLAAWAFGRSLIFDWYYCLLAFSFGLFSLLADSRQQTADSRQQTADCRQQTADCRQQTALRSFLGLHNFRFLGVLAIGLIGTLLLIRQFQFGSEFAPPNLRTARYLQIGTVLSAHCPTCSLLTSEIGGLGFGFRGRIHDAIGLVDPEATRFHPLSVPDERPDYFNGGVPPAFVRARAPDFVVSMPNFIAALRRSGELTSFHAHRCVIGTRDGEPLRIWGDTTIDVYSRLPLPSEALGAMMCTYTSGSDRLNDLASAQARK